MLAESIPWNSLGIPRVFFRPKIVQKYLPLSGKYACIVMLRNTDSGQIYIPSIQPISKPKSWRTLSMKNHISSATSETIYAAALHLEFYLSMYIIMSLLPPSFNSITGAPRVFFVI
jgi:hypothetical protein